MAIGEDIGAEIAARSGPTPGSGAETAAQAEAEIMEMGMGNMPPPVAPNDPPLPEPAPLPGYQEQPGPELLPEPVGQDVLSSVDAMFEAELGPPPAAGGQLPPSTVTQDPDLQRRAEAFDDIMRRYPNAIRNLQEMGPDERSAAARFAAQNPAPQPAQNPEMYAGSQTESPEYGNEYNDPGAGNAESALAQRLSNAVAGPIRQLTDRIDALETGEQTRSTEADVVQALKAADLDPGERLAQLWMQDARARGIALPDAAREYRRESFIAARDRWRRLVEDQRAKASASVEGEGSVPGMLQAPGESENTGALNATEAIREMDDVGVRVANAARSVRSDIGLT